MEEKHCVCCGDKLDECYVIVNGEYLCCNCDANLTAEAEAQREEDIAEYNRQRLNDIYDTQWRWDNAK